MTEPQTITRGSVTATLHLGDALLTLQTMDSGTIDLIVTSPPYCMGKAYDTSVSVSDFCADHRSLLPEVSRVLKPGGSVCWQVGHHVRNGRAVPLDAHVYIIAEETTDLVLRNRIIWTFGHGTHSKRRFSGRHESILWFTKGENYHFDVDPVRVPQRYPGKRHYKGPRKGEWSGHPLGKNPGDVWEIPNVKAKHPEKMDHPCQYPVALAQRLVRSLSRPGETVLDPFLGSGTTAVAALLENRNFIGVDVKAGYVQLTNDRLRLLCENRLRVRPDQPPREPNANEAVSIIPPHFEDARGVGENDDPSKCAA